ncbi:hypothetical protein C1922_18205 [Stenotrophomonas sp. ZAC14D2_NAIMI4_7]|uniref:hypothetical protein n=1 Tax=Stenotrophomonas TaxID=40323 RepID=UPI000D53E823|nr:MULTISPECIES: hypothetical protein [Stenotrophomonas]AWH19107.1 hypothetical protein C1922_18205 [Stenotrophomonas sp. ZAC14D2_NAIMI4_7]AWH22997.1 hypothetical protein C1933_18060 [Stenotrophomonas sp. ZAC14D2_NAIMI4_6]AWH26835.1 hypothetical protein C1932_17845 [Stenotrophomonas sp. YAU14D1_LEIMI4_1]AWH30743.1 hypothetical protein C1931_18340 [Stenotrophomonas sp. YAU14A_MKIMI4_1]AWH34686.1 hypothetical protein C1930_18260 [Stenotrophomonas sp. SAU14A_NAIMI4_8]
MIKTTPLQNALLAALLGSVALVGCKKKEESTDTNAAPAATAPAEPAPAPMTGAPPPMAAASAVAVSSVTVGKSAAADKSVATAALFAPKDDVVVSVKTDGAASNVNVGAKLTFQDGQVAGEQSATLNTSGAETTNITFKNANGWPAGKYRAEVMVDGKAAGTPQEFEVK